jgi:hypothetical protein
MGWGIGDLDGDGDLDLVHADGGPTPVYLRDAAQPGAPAKSTSYTPLPPSHPLTAWTWSTSVWSPLLADFNLDGRLDLFLGVAMEWANLDPATLDDCALDPKSLSSSDLLMLATGGDPLASDGWQAGKTPASICGMWGTLAESLVDVDLDGDLDVVQVEPNCSFDGTFQVLRNDSAGLGDVTAKVVRVRLVGPPGNRDGFGARLTAKVGGAPVVRLLNNEVGPGSTAARVLHIGLGAAAQLDDVVVTWPASAQGPGGAQAVGTLTPGPVHVIAAP